MLPSWWNTVLGIVTGGLNAVANGTSWKQILLSLGLFGLGVVGHLTTQAPASNSLHKIT
jgi:hypothetical protein